MKKLLILAALLAAGAVQADTLYWADALLGDASQDWAGATWYNATDHVSHRVPTAGDTAIINTHSLGYPIPNMPIISSDVLASKPDFLFVSWDAAPSTGGGFTVVDGGAATATHTRLGNAIGLTATLDMTGGYFVGDYIEFGYNLMHDYGEGAGLEPVAGGDGVATLTGGSVLHAGAVVFGQDNVHYLADPLCDGVGAVHMEDAARFIVNGDLIADGRAAIWLGDGRVDANGVAGKSIQAEFVSASGWTEFTVIPEPATLSLFGLIGGGMLWIRRRFA